MSQPPPQFSKLIRHPFEMWRALVCAFLMAGCLFGATTASGPEVAKRIADRAQVARGAGEVVRAYLLFAEAAKRDPSNASYPVSRDALAATATLLMKTQLEQPVVDADIRAAEKDAEEALHPTPPGARELKNSLAGFPKVQPKDVRHDFDIRGDEVSLIQQVAAVYGVRAAWDPQLDVKSNLRLQLEQADFRTAMEALTTVTNTFVFPVSTNTLYFARDSENKRAELEPVILLTVPLPEAVNDKDLVEVANAVRAILNLRSFGWDSVSRTVFIRDRVTRALSARSLMEALLLPKAQVKFNVQVLTFDAETKYHYGISPPTTFNAAMLAPFNVGVLGLLNTVAHVFTFGGGLTLTGLTLGDAALFADFSKSEARARYDAVLMTTDGQAADMHFGQKYPIPQTLYTGFSQSSTSLYQPLPQITQEDLGLVLKLTPHVTGDGKVLLHAAAEYKSLGTLTLNTVPSIAQRKFEGDISLLEGEWALIAGLEQNTRSQSRDGLAGLTDIPGLNQIFAENNRDRASSQTMILIKPEVVSLPMSATISPQYLLGPVRGVKVLL